MVRTTLALAGQLSHTRSHQRRPFKRDIRGSGGQAVRDIVDQNLKLQPIDSLECLAGFSILLLRSRAHMAAIRSAGLIGVALISIPNGAISSDTALAITAGGAIAPPSPTPLTPSGLSGEGDCKWTSC